MRRKPHEFRFEEEAAQEKARLVIGQEVPLSCKYCLGTRPRLVAIEGEMAVLQFATGARMERVPLRDLVDDSGYWKR